MSKELFENAELSQAAYATLNSGSTESSPNEDALTNHNFSDIQYQRFVQRYPSVMTQFGDPTTGFSATVFKDSTNSTGNLTIAFRGTEPGLLGLPESEDASSDAVLATSGAAFDQIISMYNWWQLVSGTPGQPVSSIQSFTIGVDTLPNNAVHVLGQQFYLVPESAIATGVPGSSGPVSILSLDTDGDPFYATAGLHLTEAEKCRENWWRFSDPA